MKEKTSNPQQQKAWREHGRGMLRLEVLMRQSYSREPGSHKEEEKENRCVLGLETIAWEKVKACCSVGPRERSGWG